MNERISKLSVETDVWCDQNWYGHEFYDVRWEEKFAELIVRECADIAKHHVMNISTYADAEFVEEQIQTHFGVEE